jgi:hypothetical protein
MTRQTIDGSIRRTSSCATWLWPKRHDADLVGGRERGGDLHPDEADLLRRERATLGEQTAEAARGHVLHDEAGQTVLRQHVECHHDVRGRRVRGHPGLAHRAVQRALASTAGRCRARRANARGLGAAVAAPVSSPFAANQAPDRLRSRADSSGSQ